MKKYESPILASIFYVCGVISFFTPILIWALAYREDLKVLAFAVLGGTLISVIYFGLGQFFDIIGKTAYTNQVIADTLPHILARLEKFDQRMAGSLPLNVSAQTKQTTTSTSQQKKVLSSRRYYYSEDGEQRGPVTFDKLKSLLESGRINEETPVCGEGDEEWVTVGETLRAG